MRRGCASRITLLGAALLSIPLPALGAEGNAPLLATPQLGGPLREALAQGRALLRGQLDGLRPKQQGSLKLMSSATEVELSRSVGKVTLDLAQQNVAVSTDLTIKAVGPQVAELYLYAPPLLNTVAKVSDAGGELVTKELGYGVLGVTLRKPLTSGQTLSLAVSQTGPPDCKASYLSVKGCMMSPKMAYSIESAWQPMLLDGYSSDIAEAQEALLYVTVTDPILVAATGLPKEAQKNGNGTTTYVFQGVDGDRFAVAAAAYDKGSSAWGADKQVSSFLTAGSAPHGAAWREAVLDVMKFHSERYGSYDLPKIDVVEVPDAAGAAFGPFSAIFLNSTLLSLGATHWSTRTTLAHELGHQWFGGIIRIGESYSPWLNEGWATFAEMDYTAAQASLENKGDYAPALRSMKSTAYVYMSKAGQDTPVTSPMIYKVPQEMYVLLTYDKGAMVVSMLRYLLGGDAAFRAAFARYRADHASKKVTVTSLLESFKGATGKDLTRFASKWIYGTGHPTFTVETRRGGRSSDGKYRTEVSVTADQDFGLPVELELNTLDGKSQLKVLPMANLKESVTVETESEVLFVRADPSRQLVCRQVSALPGDVHVNGEVDGLDLILTARAAGQTYTYKGHYGTAFDEWADLNFDGIVDQADLDVLLKGFGRKAGQGG
ncbi:MAG: hypothetical protein IT371_20615 [Deltaproteobacteria bacterium]|nr:hypothetical protein [Deltaproteobacteria bacterium]